MVATTINTGMAHTMRMNPISGSFPSLYPKNVIQKLIPCLRRENQFHFLCKQCVLLTSAAIHVNCAMTVSWVRMESTVQPVWLVESVINMLTKAIVWK